MTPSLSRLALAFIALTDLEIHETDRHLACAMARDLIHCRQVIELVPAPSPRHAGHRIRVRTSANPTWYRWLADRIPSRRSDLHRWRRFKSAIHRRCVIEGLTAIAAGRRSSYHHALLMQAIAEARRQDEAEMDYLRSCERRA